MCDYGPEAGDDYPICKSVYLDIQSVCVARRPLHLVGAHFTRTKIILHGE